MSVSVITSTASLGSLDMLFNSMACQIGGVAWEIVIADEWYESRSKFLHDYLIHHYRGIPGCACVKHVPIEKQDYVNHCKGWNTGLRAAEGKLVCFLNDYFWVYPEYIKDHWDIYKTMPGYSMTGYVDRYGWPPLKKSERVEDIWWSTFDPEFTPEVAYKFFKENAPIYCERKGDQKGDSIPGTPYHRLPAAFWYASLNESIPMEVLQELNGWDERYDRGYASNDIDLGIRAQVIGWKFLIKPTINYKIGVQSIPRPWPVKTIKKPQLRTPAENYQMFLQRVERICQFKESPKTPQGFGAWE